MKKKLNLRDLKVESFVTNIETEKVNTIQCGVSGGVCGPFPKHSDECPKSMFGLDCVYTKALCGGSKLC